MLPVLDLIYGCCMAGESTCRRQCLSARERVDCDLAGTVMLMPEALAIAAIAAVKRGAHGGRRYVNGGIRFPDAAQFRMNAAQRQR
ncbi:hypothetical protein [Caballeronia humi]|uniref:hypothetical protein n=1 Tax=Caballeronia humi TaxID=326474 RepID=UPI001F185348|nr:hypothetical protein [Caballeronia humi]